jgi:hypothetical protein
VAAKSNGENASKKKEVGERETGPEGGEGGGRQENEKERNR